MKKRILSLSLAAILLAGSLAACSSESSSGTSSGTSASVAETSAESTDTESVAESTASSEEADTATMDTSPITISVLNRVNAEIVLDDNPMLEAVAEKTGVTLEIEAPPISNYTDRLQLTMASGDLPDIIYTWEFDQNYEKWAQDGLILPLDEYIEDYPNLMANLNDDQWNRARVGGNDGQIYAVPRAHTEATWGVIANQEWLDKLGVEMPTTLDELYEYGKMVATQDPDGNGKDDTFLFSPTSLWTDCWLVFPFLPFSLQHAAPYLPDRDGEYKIKEKMDGYMPYLDFMRQLYEEGIMDPEWFTNKYYDDRTKFKQNRVALLHGGATTITEFAVQDVPNATEIYKFYPAIKGDNDEKPRNEAAASTWGGWMINADVEPEKLTRILSFLDWANSEEGFVTIAAGVQGIDYESYDLEKRELVVTEEQQTNRTAHVSGYMNFANTYQGQPLSLANTPELNEYALNAINEFKAEVDWIDIPALKCPEIDNWAAENPDIATQKEQMEVSYVVGEISKEEFETFLNDVYFPSVADAEQAYIETMNAYEASKN